MSNFLRPTYIAGRVEVLEPAAAHSTGVEAVAFDVDGTLSSYHAEQVEPSVVRMLRDLGDSGLKTVIISNAYGRRVDRLNDIYGDLVNGGVFTPASLLTRGYDDPRKHRKPSPDMIVEAGRRLGVDTGDILMVGDQMFKDVASANRAGAKSLLVPRRGEGDYWAVRAFQRPAESIIRVVMDLPDEFPETLELADGYEQ